MAGLTDGKEMAATAVALGDVVLSYQAVLAVGATNRQLSLPLANVRSGDVLSVRPTGAVPDGYDIGAAFCTADGTVTIIVAHPALALNAQFNIPVRVFRIMTN